MLYDPQGDGKLSGKKRIPSKQKPLKDALPVNWPTANYLHTGKMRMKQQEFRAGYITEYLLNNYYDDSERMSRIPIIASMLKLGSLADIPSLIDKVAIINGIKKSYPPQEIVVNA